MTTLAYRAGVLAADGRMCADCIIDSDEIVKVFKGQDGTIYGIVGSAAATRMAVDALLKGRDPPALAKDDGAVIMVRKDRTVHIYEYGGWIDLGKLRYCAWGSGGQIAKGALAMGASVVKAVEIAASLDVHTGGKIRTVEI